ncbi:MFS transporter [Picrophilus oshimae]|uniref:Major Facilitator Superfamily protein n=1 Tax=Picrophilus torridus (strain ATCC 700027 / DSM 9790 / JCM 10055 / NBRC 100828 / KAW 2/3) TaxID=1122961 RepID=A0A8G2FVN7_PICTO|nr:MFS transporter [Picrophilus oshimae]SMD30318.1 Major Facilitator Superfamily protein [Picrophilus oshimae DSM 9789]
MDDRLPYYVGFSAFFADLGYQGAMAILPVFLIFALKLNFLEFGIVEAFIYGLGSLFSYIGGRLSDIYGSKKTWILGNSLIPLLSFTAFTLIPVLSISLFSAGWWMRNLRSPARRAYLAENTEDEKRTRSFGILHGLDVGGGLFSIVILIILVLERFPYKILFLYSIIPLIISTLIIIPLRLGRPVKREKISKKNIFNGIIIATAFFGFSSYSMGFPIITVSESTHYGLYLRIATGVAIYGIFLGFSSLTGFLLSRFKSRNEALSLSIFGYILYGLGTFGFVLSIIYRMGIAGFYTSAIILAVAFGFVETYEPSIISRLARTQGSSQGILSASRSIGFFAANIIMGALYSVSAVYSYTYGALIGIVAGIILISAMYLSRNK